MRREGRGGKEGAGSEGKGKKWKEEDERELKWDGMMRNGWATREGTE